MRLGNVLHLYRIRLRRRLVQELLALTGIAVGVALVFASLVANTSLTVSMEQVNHGVVGDMRYQLAARSEAGMDQALLPRVQAIDGVRAAMPVLEARAVVGGPRGRRGLQLIGGHPRLAKHGGPLLQAFRPDRLGRRPGLAVPAPLAREIGVALGAPIEVVTGRGLIRSSLAARLESADVGELVHSPVAIAPLPYVQRVSGLRGRLTRIYVTPEPGAEQRVLDGLGALAGDRLDVRAADADVAAFHQAATPTRQSTALFSVLAALVGFLFAVSAVMLTVPHRRRFISDLRIAGYSPGAVIQVMLADALVLGVAASAVGLLAGDLLSRHLFDSVPGYLAFAFPVGSQRAVTWPSVAVAGAAGLLSACVAVLAPLREIFSRRALAGAPRPGAAGRTAFATAAAGAVCLAGVLALLAFAPSAAIPGTLLLVVAMLLLLSSLVGVAVEGLAWSSQWIRSAVPAIAVMELRSRASRTRTLALAATAAVAVFGTVAIGGAHRDLERGLNTSADEIDRNAQLWVSFPSAQNAFATTPIELSGATLRRAAEVEGVASVERYHGAFLELGDRRLWVIAPPAGAADPVPPRQIVTGDAARAQERVRDGGWVALSEAVAEEQDVGVGDRVTIPSPVPTTLRVAALTTNLGWPPGAIVLNAGDYAAAWQATGPTALHVALEPGADPHAVKRALAGELAPGGELLVETTAERQQRHHEVSSDALSRLRQISVLVVGAAVLAMVAAMVGALWQRRATIAGLKVDGFTEWELWRAVLLESLVLLSTSCAIGAAFGLLGQALMSRALGAVTGFPVFYAPAFDVATVILAGVTAITVAFLAVPGYLAVRVKPVSS